MADARRLGEIAGPMIDRLLAMRRRVSLIADRQWYEGVALLPAFVYVEETYCRCVFLLWGDARLGVAWRLFR